MLNILVYLVPFLVILLPILFFGGLGWYFVRVRKRANQRVKSFQDLAAQMNFQFLGEIPYANLTSAGNYEIFTSGNPGSQHIYNLISGTVNNIQVSIFDFAYYTGTDDRHRRSNKHLHFQTIVMLDFSQINLPPFLLKPESGKIMQAVNNALGNRSGEIHFPNHPAFSQNYLLRSKDEQRVRQLFNERIISFYESNTGLTTEGGASRMVFYRNETKIEPAQIRAALDEALTAASLFLNQNLT